MNTCIEVNGHYHVKVEKAAPSLPQSHSQAPVYSHPSQSLKAKRDAQRQAYLHARHREWEEKYRRLLERANKVDPAGLKRLPNGDIDVPDLRAKLIEAFHVEGVRDRIHCISNAIRQREPDLEYNFLSRLRRGDCGKTEAAVARFLGAAPQELWPSRYDPATGKRYGHVAKALTRGDARFAAMVQELGTAFVAIAGALARADIPADERERLAAHYRVIERHLHTLNDIAQPQPRSGTEPRA